MKTSREIIIKLIDDKKITGEEAFQLINDIVASELLNAQKTIDWPKDIQASPFSITAYPSSVTYTGGTASLKSN